MIGGRLDIAVPEPPEPIVMLGAVPVQLKVCVWFALTVPVCPEMVTLWVWLVRSAAPVVAAA